MPPMETNRKSAVAQAAAAATRASS